MMLCSRLRTLYISVSIVITAFGTQATSAIELDLRNAVILTAKKSRVETEIIATEMLQREVQKRTGLIWKISNECSGAAPVIAIVTVVENELCGLAVPRRDGTNSGQAGGDRDHIYIDQIELCPAGLYDVE